MARNSYVPNNPGFMDMARSPEIQAVLLEKARGLADAANRSARPALEEAVGFEGGFETPPFGARVDVLPRAAVGVAYSRTALGDLAERAGKSLSRHNH